MCIRDRSYNYGGGYVGYVAGKGKKHTFNLAESFAREKSGGKRVTYTNPIAVAKNGGWRYGLSLIHICWWKREEQLEKKQYHTGLNCR